MKTEKDDFPRWERGYRSHGYWLDNITEIAEVSISPSFDQSCDRYGWNLIINNYPSAIHKGRSTTLGKAKRAALQAWKQYQSTRR